MIHINYINTCILEAGVTGLVEQGLEHETRRSIRTQFQHGEFDMKKTNSIGSKQVKEYNM